MKKNRKYQSYRTGKRAKKGYGQHYWELPELDLEKLKKKVFGSNFTKEHRFTESLYHKQDLDGIAESMFNKQYEQLRQEEKKKVLKEAESIYESEFKDEESEKMIKKKRKKFFGSGFGDWFKDEELKSFYGDVRIQELETLNKDDLKRFISETENTLSQIPNMEKYENSMKLFELRLKLLKRRLNELEQES